MLVELGTALWLPGAPPAGAPRALLVAGLALLAVIWISTALLQGPDTPPRRRFAAEVHRRLVTTNWLRTIAWSAAILVSLLLLQVFRPPLAGPGFAILVRPCARGPWAPLADLSTPRTPNETPHPTASAGRAAGRGAVQDRPGRKASARSPLRRRAARDPIDDSIG